MSVSGPHVEPPSSPCLTAQEGICQLLGLVFRLHAASSKAVQGGGGGGGGSGLSSTTLLGTAAATARQVSVWGTEWGAEAEGEGWGEGSSSVG